MRSSSVIGQLIPGGDNEIIISHMYEGLNYNNSFTETPELTVLDAHGLAEIQTLPEINIWKSTPSIADFDQSTEGLEAAGGSSQGVYKLVHTDSGSDPFNSQLFDVPSFAIEGQRCSPAIADIDGDNQYELIMGIERSSDTTSLGFRVYDLATMEIEWSWLDTMDSEIFAGVIAAITVGDIDNDNQLEIVFLSTDGIVYAMDGYISGCTNSTACNYNPLAENDDASCQWLDSDFNLDGAVNVADLLIFSSQFGCTINCGEGDINLDSSVNVTDLLIFTSEFGSSCY